MNFLDLIWLIPLFPVAGFIINGLFGKRMPKAAVGVAGVRIALTPWAKQSSKSRLMRVRTFCARR